MKGDTQVVVAILMFIAGAFLGALMAEKLVILFDRYLPALVTLFAAYWGARYAFTLQSDKEKRDIRNKQIEAGLLELFNFIRMRNSLLNYQKKVINSVPKEIAFIEMKPTLSTLKIESKLALENLSFLLKSDPDLLSTLYLARTNLQNLLEAINGRTKFYLEEVQPKWESSKLSVAGKIDPENPNDPVLKKIKDDLGERIYKTMDQTTNDIINKVESSLTRLESAENELREALIKTFPEDEATFLNVSEAGVDKK